MARVRIVAKRHPQAHPMCALSFTDSEVFVIHDDGTEEPLQGVTGVEWSTAVGTEPNKATLSFVGVEADIEAEVDLPGGGA